MSRNACSTLLFALAFLGADRECLAQFVPVPLAPQQGMVTEKGKPGKLVAITWTTNSGVPLGTTAAMAIPATGVLNIPVPQMSPDRNNTLRRVYDYVQFSKDGPDNYLSVEAFVPSGSAFLEYPFLSYIASVLGPAGSVSVPDLYADTNGDHIIGDGDVLYSAVNLAVFIPAHVTFGLDDNFTITDGTSPSLPGMVFGTQPITLDASNSDGFSNPDPYTGVGTDFTVHDNIVTPEPADLILLACGFLVLGLVFRRAWMVVPA